MKKLLLTTSLLAALGTAQAATTQAAATLGMSQNLARPQITLAMNTTSPDTPTSRAKLPVAPTSQDALDSTATGPGFEWDSSLVLALAGALALTLVARRRLPR